MKRTLLAIFLIGVLLFVYAFGALYVPAQHHSATSRWILEDRDLFEPSTRDNFNTYLQTLRWNKLRQSLPKEKPVSLYAIQQKYGQADTVITEKAPRVADDLDIDFYLQGEAKPTINWTDVAVHYYGGVGFGVDENDATGAVLFITNRAAAMDFEAASEPQPRPATPEEQQNLVPAAGNFDGNWQDATGALAMVFTVADNAVTQGALLNLRTNICNDGGAIFAAYTPPIAIEGNALRINIDGSSGSNVWLTTVTGTFTSDSMVSGRQSVLILGNCGFVSGSVNFSITRQPDYYLFTTPSNRNIVLGETTTYTIGMRPLGSFNQPVQVDLLAPTLPGITLTMSSNTIQPNGNVTLTVAAAANATPVAAALGFATSTGSTSHLTIANLRLRNFELSLNPGTQIVGKGQGATFTLNSRTMSYTTPVTLSAAPPSSSGITVNFASPTLVPGQSVNFTANSATTTPTGSHSITITAQSGSVRETITATLRVSDPDFAIVITPASQLVAPGGAMNFDVAINPLIGFNQAVNLSSAVSPNDGNVTVSFAANPVNAGGNATMTVRASSAAQQNSTFTITVTGTSGALTHTATARVTVSGPDFSLSVVQSTINGTIGTKVPILVMINRVGGFNGNVTITPQEITARGIVLSTEPVSTTGNELNFRVKLKGKALPGTYPITFTGRDDTGKTRTVTVTLVVAP